MSAKSGPQNPTSLKGMQKDVDEWVSQFEIPYWPPFEILARLTEEVGEVAREISHRFGTKKKKSTEEKVELEDEVADILFTLVCLSNSLGLDMEAGFNRTMEKSRSRDKNRFTKK